MTAEKVEEILRSAYQELYSKNFWKARNLFRDVLQVDPNNKKALFGEVLADKHVCYSHELLEDPFFIGSEDYQRLIQHDALRPYQNDLNRHLEERYQDAMERALHPEHFWDNYWDEDEEKFAHDFYMDQVYHKFVVLGDYKDAAQKAENFKEFHQVRNRYKGLCSYREYLYDKKNEWLSKKKKSDWCSIYNAACLIFIAILIIGFSLPTPKYGTAYYEAYDIIMCVCIAPLFIMMIFSAITWNKLGKNASFWEGLIMSALFSFIVWIYMWIKSLPFVFSRRKNTIELEKVKEKLENCQKEIAELSPKFELYKSIFDLQ